MNRKGLIVGFGVTALLLLLYAVSSLFNNNFWSTVLAPLVSIGPALILLTLYFKEEKSRRFWIYLSLAVFFWFLADSIWAVYDLLLAIDPEESIFIGLVYFLPNVMLCMAVGFLLITSHKIWNRLQMTLDILVISIVGISVIWMIFLGSEFEKVADFDAWSVITFSYAVTDIFCIGCIGLWQLTTGSGRKSKAMRTIMAAILLYCFVDLIYGYQYFNEIYEPNTLLDVFYLFSFVLLGWGALMHRWQSREMFIYKLPDKSDKNPYFRRSSIVILGPVGLFLLQAISWKECLLLTFILVTHQAVSGYISSGRINAQLLQHEKQVNTVLEEQIELRTRELSAINKELEIVSNHDSITSFFNRRHFMVRFDHILKENRPYETVALFFADLDHFKAINDTYGHDIGDKVLAEVGRRMKEWNIYQATVARLGGDEFVIALRGYYKIEEIAEIAQKLIDRCNETFHIPPYQFHISVSIGITRYPMDAGDRVTLLKNADIAMYHAKTQGCNQFAFYNSQINEQVERKNRIEMLLRVIDYDQEFKLRYQPQFSTTTLELKGFEALLDWESPILGQVPPNEFISIAEETGVIIPIGEWVISRAAAQIGQWNRQHNLQLSIGINVSPKQLDSTNFITHVEKTFKALEIPPEWLDFEIIESAAMKGSGLIPGMLLTLSALGVNISIDEFGTGYSSLNYLKRYSIDRLKIARSMVENIAVGNCDYQIIKAIILMAKAMNIRTIAQGVETEEQRRLLSELECDEVQGFLFGQPMIAEQAGINCLQNSVEAKQNAN